MKSRLALTLLVLVLSLTSSLMNPDFEEGWHLETTYWTPEGGPYFNQFIEITPPEGWTAWWYEGFPCSVHPSLQGRPVVRVISTTPDLIRIHSGDQALKFFTFWRCHRGGVYQQITVEPGKCYTARAYGHCWFSNCSTRPHYHLPLDYDCDTENPILWAHDWLRIGIDPLGGIDPTAPSVKWGAAQEVYGTYSDQPLTIDHVAAISNTLTIFLQSDASHPLKHCDVYWDNVSLLDTTYRLFLPIVRRY